MAEFVINTDVITPPADGRGHPDSGQAAGPGRHRFRLIVIDDSGNKSAPDEVLVLVADQENPTAVLSAPSPVPFGKSFTLDAPPLSTWEAARSRSTCGPTWVRPGR